MRLAFAAALCCGLMMPHWADAQSFQSACKVRVLCPGVQPGGGRLVTCLRAHKSQLSVPCRLAIADFFLNKQGGGGGGQGGRSQGAGQGGGGGYNRGPNGPGGGERGPEGAGPEDPDGQGPGPGGPGQQGPGPDGPDQGPPPR